ncbi:MAG TPA: anti-sigma factor [Angustibacter sp.]|nr:anti-sigma factor [Angustibacter sp.]
MTCRYAHLDGAYVLGALAPGERQEFEQHLHDCPACAEAVQELAGLPGLLARVDADVLDDAPSADEHAPDTLLPSLVREVRHRRRRRTVVTAMLAAAAALVVAAAGVAASQLGQPTDRRPAAAPTATATSTSAGRPMTAVQPAPMSARLAVQPVAWGTRLVLTCRYDADDTGYGEAAEYALVVRTQDGRTEQVATWRALPGQQMELSGATSARAADIAAVEVRLTGGATVLRLQT